MGRAALPGFRVLAGLWLALTVTPAAGCGGRAAAPSASPRAPEETAEAAPSVASRPASRSTAEDLASRWGIQVTALRLTSAGYMVDFRFKVIDPVKAAPLLARQAERFLVDEASGERLRVPEMAKVGSLRQTTMRPEAGRIYFVLFGNTGGRVRAGSRVTVSIGEFKAEHLVVE